MSCRADLLDAIQDTWRAFECALAPPRVKPSIPILFFGDLKAYCESDLRVVTVGLNPSLGEFLCYPAYDREASPSPFLRFPLAEGITANDTGRYLDSLSAYFCTEPYWAWFSAFEPILNGLGSSYCKGYRSRALHTDICSPVATDPTWSKLKKEKKYRDVQADMKAKGVPLWHKLIKVLKPDVGLISVAKEHLSRIEDEFNGCGKWKAICEFDKKKNGEGRKLYKVWARWYEVCDKYTLFVFGQAAQTPFGSLSME